MVRLYRLGGEPSPVELGRRLVEAVGRRLALEPLGQLGQALLERNLGLEAERLARACDICEAVADVAGAELARQLGLDRLAEQARERLGDLEHRGALAAADVDRL